jgi:GNAT superfamily N-acetyltransferase
VEELANEFRIRRASIEDVEGLHAVLAACGLDLRDRLGLTHWFPAYPRDLFEEQAAKGWVFAVEKRDDTEIMATFTASQEAPAYLDLSLWGSSGEPSLYLTRLAVLPRFQRRGIGRACIGAVERLALERDCRSVRLDAAELHARLLNWYVKLDYREVGRYEALGNRMVGFEKLVTSQQS